MANAQWTMRHHAVMHERLAYPLDDRVVGGRGFWLIGRLLLGGVFLMSGIEKLMDLDKFAAGLVKGGIPENMVSWLAPLGAGIETLGGALIILGLATRWTSLIMLTFTVVAALIAHRFWEAPPDMYEMQMNHFLKNVMIAGAFLMLYVAGGGPCSIDRWWRDRNDLRLTG